MRSINRQFRSDLKAARKIWLPWRALLLVGVCFIAVFMLFDYFGNRSAALPAMMCAAVFAFLTYVKRPLRRHPVFWAIIAVFAAVHAALIWHVLWTTEWILAATVASIATADFCLMLWVLAALDVWLGRQPEIKT